MKGSTKLSDTTNILFLSANPSKTVRLRVDEEVRGIDIALMGSRFRQVFAIEKHFAVRVDDLSDLLLRYQPSIVHFSGHGSDKNQIIVENGSGAEHPLPPQALSKLFEILKDNIQCVVLNACFSLPQAEAIAQHIDYVIGMTTAIQDSSALKFSQVFYRALGYGRDIQTAFDLGCLQLDLENLSDSDIPQLIAPRCNPSKIKFVQNMDGLEEVRSGILSTDRSIEFATEVDNSIVQLSINEDYASFSNEDQQKILDAIHSLLGIQKGTIKIRQIKQGSVLLDIELPTSHVEELIELVESGKFAEYNIFSAKVLAQQQAILEPKTISSLVAESDDHWIQMLKSTDSRDNESANEKLWVFVYETIFRYVARHPKLDKTTDVELVHDLAVKAFSIVSDRINSFKDANTPRFLSWVRYISVRVVADELRKRVREDQQTARSHFAFSPEFFSIASVESNSDFVKIFSDVFNNVLTLQERTLFFEKFVMERSNKEIADSVGTNESSVNQLIHDVRIKLRMELMKRGFTSADSFL